MLYSLVVALSVASVAHSSVLRRQDPGLQAIPATARADNTFNNGAPKLNAEPPQVPGTPPAVYGARSVDLPFGRLYHGNMIFFPAGQLNTPDGITDQWINTPANPTQNGADSANQSACGIPDNAFFQSKVAIHPYFLKYADLSRYCMQDVCISFWKEDGSSDMMLKVTDICCTDATDPTCCATPQDIKIDRSKAQVMEGLTNPSDITAHPELMGHSYPGQTWWFFMKCWDDALAQPAYQGNNWFTDPPLINNLQWAQAAQTQQTQNNQIAYAAKGWPTYPNGAFNPKRDNTTSPPITDWAPGDPTPAWSPVAGGKGWSQSNPLGSENPPASLVGAYSSVPLSATPSLANGAITPSSVAPIGVATSIPGVEPSLQPAIIPGPSASASAKVSGQGEGQGLGQGQGGATATTTMISDPHSNATTAAPLPPSYTPVPGLVQAGTEGNDKQDECDEL